MYNLGNALVVLNAKCSDFSKHTLTIEAFGRTEDSIDIALLGKLDMSIDFGRKLNQAMTSVIHMGHMDYMMSNTLLAFVGMDWRMDMEHMGCGMDWSTDWSMGCMVQHLLIWLCILNL